MITPIDDLLNTAIRYEKLDDLIYGIQNGASLMTSKGREKRSSNLKFQAVLKFVRALDEKKTTRQHAAEILEISTSPQLLQELSTAEPHFLRHFIKKSKLTAHQLAL